MTSFRILFKDLNVRRLWSVWSRNYIVGTVFKKCRRDRAVREVIQCFRQTILRPRRTLLLSATAAFKSRDEDDNSPPGCDKNITDDDLEALLTELEGVDRLSKTTLFCTGCGKRLVIEKKHPRIQYCMCKDPQPTEESDGWVPYMEAEDVIIWRKEYKAGQGLYAYKVYGRYKEVRAQDFAAVQVDGAYRKVWDAAVASLSVVERSANGVLDQAVLHWEVLWPRLFANRDYVYIRRHKEFNIKTKITPKKEEPCIENQIIERPSVHSNAKRKAMEMADVGQSIDVDNKVYIIVSRSCEHPNVPETKHAIRVSEYWSHMVVKTLEGADKPGMEFVLTYYDEPAVGGLPTGVATWATGRAAPAYLERMRKAANDYRDWRYSRHEQDLPDYMPFGPETLSLEVKDELPIVEVREQDMESSKQGPELNGEEKKDESTQTDDPQIPAIIQVVPVKQDKCVDTTDVNKDAPKGDSDKPEEEENNGGWWRYLYPFYYFV